MYKAMKCIITLLLIIAISASPISAQSYKEKKEAKKALWEMEQKQKREEAELLHQLKMDSIANVHKSYVITCYRLTRHNFGWSKVTKQGRYNSEDKILVVGDERFPVCENPVYGEKSTPGSYMYKAGSYYFNE